MLAQKDNKTYTISEAEKKMYLADGYDIYSDEGELLERSPSAAVSWAVHERALARIKELEAELAEKEGKESEQSKGGKSKKAD
jgi:hypothetical protein